jgi:3-methyladenine DNA glycosylase Tag
VTKTIKLKPFSDLYALAAARKGGPQVLESMIGKPKSAAALARIPDDRWLAGMAKAVFRSGFNWKVVDHKWPSIEEAFDGFDPVRVAHLSDEQLEALVNDPRVIRNWRKLTAIRTNAAYVTELAVEHGTAAKYFARYASTEFIGLLQDIKARGAFLGGPTGQYFLRELGKDSFILSRDVVAAVQREHVFDGSPTSKASLKKIQDAFNAWVADGGDSLTRVSRVLAFTVG